MESKFLPVLIISFLWASIFNLCKESVTIQKNIYALGFIKIILIGIIGMISLLIFQTETNIIEEIKKTDNKVFTLLIISCTFEVISSFFYFHSLKNNDASWSVPMIEAGIILVSVLMSIYFFREKLTTSRILGIFTILLGIFLVY
jgi:uncharacterized membrane protein